MKKRTKIFLGLSPICLLTPLAIVSCGSSEQKAPEPSSSFEKEINDLIKTGAIAFGLNSLPQFKVSEDFFLQLNEDEKKKAFELKNTSSLELDWSIISLDYDSTDNKKLLTYSLLITEKQNPSNQVTIKSEIKNPNWATNNNHYFQSAYNEMKKNIILKEEYKNKDLLDLFEQNPDVSQFIQIKDQEKYVGLSAKILVPSQTTTIKTGLEVNLALVRNNTTTANGEIINNISPGRSSYLNLEQKQKKVLTMITSAEINTNAETIPKTSYFGPLFIKPTTKDIIFNASFSNKEIIGELDLSPFTSVEFNSKSGFMNNKIDNIKFNDGATVKNFPTNLFLNNKIKIVKLPKKTLEFVTSAFDSTVKFEGLQNIPDIDKTYNPNTQTLDLRTIDNFNDAKKIIEIINRSGTIIPIKEVFIHELKDHNNQQLPTIQNLKKINIYTNKKILNKNQSNKFTMNILNWKPEAIFIDPTVLNLNVQNIYTHNVEITRTLNPILNKYLSNGTLEINDEFLNSISPISQLNLDNYFLHTKTTIKKLSLNFQNQTNTININTILNTLSFFEESSNKSISISSNIYNVEYTPQTGINIDRQAPKNDGPNKWFDEATKEINIEKLYSAFPDDSNLNLKIDGLLIQNIELGAVNIIKDSTFKDVDLSNVTAFDSSSRLTQVGNNAFYNSGLAHINLTKTTSIGSYAFYGTKLTGNISLPLVTKLESSCFSNISTSFSIIDLSNKLTEIPDSTFQNSNLSKINLENITSIGSSAFYGTKLTGDINLPLVTKLGSSCFSNISTSFSITLPNQLTSIPNNAFQYSNLSEINLENITSIGSSAFYNTKLTTINLSKTTSIGSSAFYGTKLTGNISLPLVTTLGSSCFSNISTSFSITLPNQLTEIPNNAFQNSNLSQINLENITKIGSSAFYNTKLTTINLSKITSIGSSAFVGSNNITQVDNFSINAFFNSELSQPLSNYFSNIHNINWGTEINPQDVGFNRQTNSFHFTESIKWNNKLVSLLEIFLNKNDISKVEQVTFADNYSLFYSTPSSISSKKFADVFQKITIKQMSVSQATSIPQLGGTIRDGEFRNLRIETIDEKAFLGITSIGSQAFSSSHISAQKLDFSNATTIGWGAFSNNKIQEFVLSESLKKINSSTFNSNVSMSLPPGVEIEDNAFSLDNALPPKVTRNKIFADNSPFNKVYNQSTKTLDFSKLEIKDFGSVGLEYLYISKYLMDGDVDILILPNTELVTNNLINNLGTIKEIKFSDFNQQILGGAFSGTTIETKPTIKETNILYNDENSGFTFSS